MLSRRSSSIRHQNRGFVRDSSVTACSSIISQRAPRVASPSLCDGDRDRSPNCGGVSVPHTRIVHPSFSLRHDRLSPQRHRLRSIHRSSRATNREHLSRGVSKCGLACLSKNASPPRVVRSYTSFLEKTYFISNSYSSCTWSPPRPAYPRSDAAARALPICVNRRRACGGRPPKRRPCDVHHPREHRRRFRPNVPRRHRLRHDVRDEVFGVPSVAPAEKVRVLREEDRLVQDVDDEVEDAVRRSARGFRSLVKSTFSSTYSSSEASSCSTASAACCCGLKMNAALTRSSRGRSRLARSKSLARRPRIPPRRGDTTRRVARRGAAAPWRSVDQPRPVSDGAVRVVREIVDADEGSGAGRWLRTPRGTQRDEPSRRRAAGDPSASARIAGECFAWCAIAAAAHTSSTSNTPTRSTTMVFPTLRREPRREHARLERAEKSRAAASRATSEPSRRARRITRAASVVARATRTAETSGVARSMPSRRRSAAGFDEREGFDEETISEEGRTRRRRAGDVSGRESTSRRTRRRNRRVSFHRPARRRREPRRHLLSRRLRRTCIVLARLESCTRRVARRPRRLVAAKRRRRDRRVAASTTSSRSYASSGRCPAKHAAASVAATSSGFTPVVFAAFATARRP